MSVPRTVQPRRERRLAERAARHDARHRPRTSRRFGLGTLSLIGLVGGLVVVALAIALSSRPASVAEEPSLVSVARAPAGVQADGFVLGRADAPVTIDLYEDFQCPACGMWARQVFPTLVTNEVSAGSAKVVFHDMAFLGPESSSAGRAAWAAAQQGRFWDMWTTLYANQGSTENAGAFSDERLLEMANLLGLDAARFTADMESAAAQASIDGSRDEAARAGVSSTPTLVIDGTAFVGVRPYAEIAEAIAAAGRP